MKNNIFVFIKEIIISIIGCFIAAFGTTAFLLPNQLSSGGFSGIATILYYYLGLPMGTTIIFLNIPFFIIAYFKLGKDFFIKSIISTLSFSKFIDFLDGFILIKDDKFLASIYGGVIVGIGLAIVFKYKSSTGGSDLIGQIVGAFDKKIKIYSIMIVLDIIIVSLNTLFFKQIVVGLYSIISIYIIEKMLDIVFEGINFCKAIYIISDKSQEISNVLTSNLDRGVTGLYGKGIFKNKDKVILMCVTKKREIGRIMELARNIDKNSFIIVVDAREVYGLGFKTE